MQRHFGGRRTAIWFGLMAASAVGVMQLAIEQGRASGHARSEAGRGEEPGVAEARALVALLEARVQAAEANLKQAKELLAKLEGTEKPAPTARPVRDDRSAVADKRLEGVWRIVSIDGNYGGEFRKPPYDEYKIMTAGHYLWLSFDPETGKVLRSGGGTYSLKGEKYTAHIDYSNSVDLRAVVGQDYTGTCKLEGKRWYHYGRVPSGGVFDELWERVH
jgi:hypothetical protein